METSMMLFTQVGKNFSMQMANVLRQNGDTTSRELMRLIPSPDAILESLVEEGVIQKVGKHYRLTEKGRENL